jgi:hypothetical protein
MVVAGHGLTQHLKSFDRQVSLLMGIGSEFLDYRAWNRKR